MKDKNGIPIMRHSIARAQPGKKIANEHPGFVRKKAGLLHTTLCNREEGRCWYCGRKLPVLLSTVDHQTPIVCGGETILPNLVYCCRRCNVEKGNYTVDLYRTTKYPKVRFVFWGEQADRPAKRKAFDEKHKDDFTEIGQYPKEGDSADQGTNEEGQEEVRSDP